MPLRRSSLKKNLPLAALLNCHNTIAANWAAPTALTVAAVRHGCHHRNHHHKNKNIPIICHTIRSFTPPTNHRSVLVRWFSWPSKIPSTKHYPSKRSMRGSWPIIPTSKRRRLAGRIACVTICRWTNVFRRWKKHRLVLVSGTLRWFGNGSHLIPCKWPKTSLIRFIYRTWAKVHCGVSNNNTSKILFKPWPDRRIIRAQRHWTNQRINRLLGQPKVHRLRWVGTLDLRPLVFGFFFALTNIFICRLVRGPWTLNYFPAYRSTWLK